ncbi:MAG: 2-hydroxyacid dehydrogenase [Marmoricola sp.]
MSDPLVWLPFHPDRLGEPPAGLRYEKVWPEPDREPTRSIAEVQFYVPPYQLGGQGNDLLARMPKLRVVQTLTAGVEHIRTSVPDGVTLCNGRGIHDTSTAELVLALTLASLRGIPEFVREQDGGVWDQRPMPALADKRVLIVGYGSIGEAIEHRLLPFEVEVVKVARSAREGVHAFEDLASLVPEADVVVLVVPLTEQTRGMVDAEFLARMKDDALLVNVARGAVVDTDALLVELGDERIAAALDVFDTEPLPSGHPLWTAPRLLMSPHVGGGSSAMWPRAYRLVREQLERFAAGQPLVNQMTGDY